MASTMMAQNEVQDYGYNTRDELISGQGLTYNYDDIGNRTTAEGKTYTANELNQYTAIDTFEPQYDADGNQTLIQTSTGIWSVTYNAENRPVRWECGDTVVTMNFDRMGRHVFYKEEVNGEVTKHHRFVYDNYLCVQKLDALNNNSQINLFVWDPTESVATRPLFMLANPGNYKLFYTFDGNKNVSELVHFESRNGIAAHYNYASFGAVTRAISASAVADNTFTTDNPFRFSSEYHDDTLGLVYYNYRHYNPTDGRWCGRDLVEEGNGDISQYLFCSNCLSFDMLGLYVPNLDMKACTLTLTFLIVFRYPEDNEDYRLSFLLDQILYEFIVGNAFNSNSFALFPKDVPNLRECCPNGIKPQVGFDFIFADDGYTGKRVDYIINIKDETKGRQRSRTGVRKNVIPESDVFLEDFCSSSTTLAHEFGHGPLELEHPGSDVNNPTTRLSYEKNSFEEYSHTGTDKKGRHVSKEDLMGLGDDLRLFYFDLWTNWSM